MLGEANRNQKAKIKKKKHGGVSSDSVHFKSLDFPWKSTEQLQQLQDRTCPSSWSSGGVDCCADFQVLALGGAALPLPGAGLSRDSLPREAPGGQPQWRRPALEPWIQLPQLLQSFLFAGPGGSGGGAADLLR